MTKVSVITVAYNAENIIEKTLQSVVGQCSDNIEYIIKDGNSIDNTNAIIKNFIADKYTQKEIKHIISNDKGIYDAMNIAVSACTGEWVIFMNAGDIFVRNNIVSEIFDETSYEGYDVLYGDAVIEDSGERNVWTGNIEHITKSHPCHQACFYKRKILSVFPFNQDFRIAADYNQLLDIYLSGGKFYQLKKSICLYSMDGISSTQFIERVKEKRKADIAHGYTKISDKIAGCCDYILAYLKSAICGLIPIDKQKLLRKIYKKYIKGYR